MATIPISDLTTNLITVYVVGRQISGANRAGYVRQAVIYREGGGATLLSTVDTPLTRESNAAWNCTISVSGNNALVVVTGAAGATIDWRVQYFMNSVN
jgi:hypothetical protein